MTRIALASFLTIYGVSVVGCAGSNGSEDGPGAPKTHDAASDVESELMEDASPTDAAGPDAKLSDADAGEGCATGTWDDDHNPSTPCLTWSTCAAGSYASQLPTKTSDRICTPCADGHYTSTPDQTACFAWSICAAGTYVVQQGTASSDRSCVSCSAGHYSTAENAIACIDGTCGPGTAQTMPATRTAPATCSECPPGTWDNDRDPLSACAPWRDCGIGQFMYAQGTATLNRGCTTCPANTYNPSTINAAKCSPWNDCAAETYVSTEGTPSADRTCTACPPGYSSGGKSIPFCHAPVVGLAAGAGHTCAVLADGRVACWGYNYRGAIGNGTTTTTYVPQLVSGLDRVVQVAAGYGHACALSNDGTVRCWGANGQGQLGDGTTVDRYSPTLVKNLTGAVEIVAEGPSTCARLVDGSVQCWGYNGYGELGDGTRVDRPLPVSVLKVTQATSLAAGFGHVCVTFADRTATCWGYNEPGTMGDGTAGPPRTAPSTPASISGVAQLALGANTSCARRVDGTVACWGVGSQGELGNGMPPGSPPSPLPTEVFGISNATGLVGNESLFCAVLADGTARYWGIDAGSRLAPVQLVPSTIPLDGITIAAAGSNHLCVVSHGSVMCWGASGVGDDATSSAMTWRPVAW